MSPLIISYNYHQPTIIKCVIQVRVTRILRLPEQQLGEIGLTQRSKILCLVYMKWWVRRHSPNITYLEAGRAQTHADNLSSPSRRRDDSWPPDTLRSFSENISSCLLLLPPVKLSVSCTLHYQLSIIFLLSLLYFFRSSSLIIGRKSLHFWFSHKLWEFSLPPGWRRGEDCEMVRCCCLSLTAARPR